MLAPWSSYKLLYIPCSSWLWYFPFLKHKAQLTV